MQNRNKTKILFLTKHFLPDLGGTEIYCKNVLEFLKTKDDISVDIITFRSCQKKERSLEQTVDNNIKIIRINLLAPPRSISINIQNHLLPQIIIESFIYFYLLLTHAFSFIYLIIFICLYLKKNKIDKIYTVGGLYIALIGSITSAIYKKNIIFHFHADFQFSKRNTLLRSIIRGLLNKGDYIFVNSLDGKIDLLKLGLQEEKIAIIHNWVDQSLFRPLDKDSCRKKLDLPCNKFILLFATRLSIEKHIDLLFKAIDLINQRENNFIFLFIGDGDKSRDVCELKKKYNNVLYYGKKENSELPVYINAANICWGVSDINYISISTIESLASGIPVIIPDRVNPIFGENKYRRKVKMTTLPKKVGFLVTANYLQIAEVLLRLEKKRRLLLDMRGNCLDFISKYYGYSNAEKIYRILKIHD